MVFTREDFHAYIRHFNEKEYHLQHSFYGENCSLQLPALEPLMGSAAIQQHYDFVHDLADETLDIVALMFDNEQDPRKIFYENNSWFRFKKDHDHADPAPGKKGDLVLIKVWITYEINKDGTFGKITCNGLSSTNMGPIPLPPPEPGVIRPRGKSTKL
ncbi:hypothetical protein T439DRAFT_353303 [Meredithblackwellia eburnea MCA 4105]